MHEFRVDSAVIVLSVNAHLKRHWHPRAQANLSTSARAFVIKVLRVYGHSFSVWHGHSFFFVSAVDQQLLSECDWCVKLECEERAGSILILFCSLWLPEALLCSDKRIPALLVHRRKEHASNSTTARSD